MSVIINHRRTILINRYVVPDGCDGTKIDPRWDKSAIGMPLGRCLIGKKLFLCFELWSRDISD